MKQANVMTNAELLSSALAHEEIDEAKLVLLHDLVDAFKRYEEQVNSWLEQLNELWSIDDHLLSHIEAVEHHYNYESEHLVIRINGELIYEGKGQELHRLLDNMRWGALASAAFKEQRRRANERASAPTS